MPLKVYLTDRTGSLLNEIVNGETIRVPEGGTLIAESDKIPVSFFFDGKFIRTEAKPPLSISGDNGVSINTWDGLTLGDHRLDLIVGPNHEKMVLGFNVKEIVDGPLDPEPPKPSSSSSGAGSSSSSSGGTVGLPKLTRMVAPITGKRGEGIAIVRKPNYSLKDTHIEGYNSNLTIQYVTGPVTVDNYRGCRAWRDEPKDIFKGHALYMDKLDGPTKITNFLARDNGWQTGKPPLDLSQFRHGVYSNFGAKNPLFENCIIAGSANVGIQLRGGGVIRNCVFLDNSVAVYAVMGNCTIENCTIYDGHYHCTWGTKDGQTVVNSWTSNSGVQIIWPTVMRDVWIIGRPGQGNDPGLVPNVKCYAAGAVGTTNFWGGGAGHSDWKPAPGGVKLDAKDCLISGWPGKPFAGDRPHDGTGFVVKTNPVTYNYKPVLDAVERNEISIKDAIKKLHAEIRALVK